MVGGKPFPPRLIEGATLDHARRIAPNLRLADRLEISRATGGMAPREALERSIQASRETFRVEHAGAVVILGGCCPSPADPKVGTPWMMATGFITSHPAWFLRNSAAIWRIVTSDYAALFNLVDARNTAHQRWLEWSGCNLGATRLLHGNPFIEFTRFPCVSPL